MSIQDTWAKGSICPCGGMGNKKKNGGYRCTKCGKEFE